MAFDRCMLRSVEDCCVESAKRLSVVYDHQLSREAT
jgi:hypothetical protein